MSIVSLHMPGDVGLSMSEQPNEIPTPDKSPGELDGCRKSMPKEDALGNGSAQPRKKFGTKSGRARS